MLGGVIFFATRGSSPEEEAESLELPQNSEPSEIITPTTSPTPSLSPTPSEKPKENVNKSSLKVAVQNGSGEGGVAAKAAVVLKDAGYSVTLTGNADNFDYIDVTIKVKSIKKGFLAGLEKDLSGTYTIGKATSDLSSDASYDALVIIGK